MPIIDSSPRPPRRLRTLLILGRISNLPTVWSNCLAAWLLGGGGPWERFGIVCLGATWLYTGGMFLNDAFDVEFDREHRPERPIPSGQIGRGAVWALGASSLAVGCFILCPLGMGPAIAACGLLAAIVIYDAIHKSIALAPLLMSGCRFLLYLLAAVSAKEGLGAPLFWRALALAVYVAGLSCLARRESTGAPAARWAAGLLLAPLVVAWLGPGGTTAVVWIPAAVFVVWVCGWAGRALFGAKPNLPTVIAGLLAGIVLVDWLAAADAGNAIALVFVGLFALANLMQRVAPAT